MAKTRGTLTISSTDYSLGMFKETITIQGGLIHKNLPGLASDRAWQMAVWGRGREITIEGFYNGNQETIETFIAAIENWVNEDASFQTTAQYYPMFHKNNTAAGSAQQSEYYNVMCDQFTYTYDENKPTQLTFTLVLREGTKLGVFSALAGEA